MGLNQLLQLCTARTVWPDAVIKAACFSPFYLDGDPIGIPRIIHRQTSYYYVMLRPVTNETSYDSVVLTKDTGVIRSLSTDANR